MAKEKLKTITYGVLSDFHTIDPRLLAPTIDILKSNEVDALVLNGDIFGEMSGLPPNAYLTTLLEIAGRSSLETYVLPGSHETVYPFDPILNLATTKYPNIINTLKNPKIDKGNHHLVFLPGAESRAGPALYHGYVLQRNETPSGTYECQGGLARIINMNDIKQLITDPDKTIVFSHYPQRFDNFKEGVDIREFWELQKQALIKGNIYEPGTKFALKEGEFYAKQGLNLELKRENLGSTQLRDIFDELNIKKSISGHFHESAGKAHDLYQRKIDEGTFTPQLFYNASCMDNLKAGMVTINPNDNTIAYENVDLKKHFENMKKN